MHSCLYEGRVTHYRFSPVKHHFQYRLFMAYLDLAELPQLLVGGRFISGKRWAPASFQRDDHLRMVVGRKSEAEGRESSAHTAACSARTSSTGFSFSDSGSPTARRTDVSDSLDETVRELVANRTGSRPRGPIRLLTQLRYFGHYFSPLNLYFCFAPQGQQVETIVAEVSNTPWREQHCYVLWEGNRCGADAELRFAHPKSFHVSPFMDMDAEYGWQFSRPGNSLDISVTNTRAGRPFFSAGLSMTRRPLTRGQLTRASVRFPLMTAQIMAAIYYQALRLWMKKCPFYPHPNKRSTTARLSA